MQGLMMDYPLTLTTFLERARRLYSKQEIVTRGTTETFRYTYGDFYQRACRLANVLRELGVRRGPESVALV
jgi:fatty-acyl-CoA synthase